MAPSCRPLDIRLPSFEAGQDALAAHQTFHELAAQLLGSERYTRFERAQDPEFQVFFSQGIASGWEPSTIEAKWVEAQRQLVTDMGEP